MDLRRILKRNFLLFDEEAQAQLHGIDVYEHLIEVMRSQLRWIGYDVLDVSFKPNMMTWFSSFCLMLFILFGSYTVILHWGDWFQVIETLSLFGMGSSTLIKAYIGLVNAKYYQENNQRLTSVYVRNINHKENNSRLVYWGVLITYIFIFFQAVGICGGFGFFIFPIVTYFRFQERILVLNLHVPGLETDSLLGFVITTIFHIVLIVMAVAGILAADLGTIIVVGHMPSLADVFINGLQELDELTEKEDRKLEDTRKQVLEICVMHRELIGYEEMLNENYGSTVFVQVLSSVACISLSLFNFYMTYHIGSLTFMVFSFFQLLEFCVLGTVVKVKNDEIMRALYDTCWYRLSIEEQKMIGFMLHRAQNPVEMTVGGLALLNIETFVDIIKRIYSYSAMLVQFLE